MYEIQVAELSASAGQTSDGIIRGRVNQSQLTAAAFGSLEASTIYALRRDVNGGDEFIDISAEAVSDVADSLLPWGDDTAFGQSDELWLAADKCINKIYVDITTPGQWTGTGLSVLESIDGEALTPVTNLVDGTDGLRNAAGVYEISFDINRANRQEITPLFGGTKRKYVVLRPDGLTATTVAPKLNRIWLASDAAGVTYTDQLGQAAGEFDDNSFPDAADSVFPLVGDALYYGLPNMAMGVDDAMFRARLNASGVYEYLASDGTWKVLTEMTDPGDQLREGPAVLNTTAEEFSLRWTVPTDWTAQSLTLFPADAHIAHWLRLRTTLVSPFGQVGPALYRRRVRAFGEGNCVGIRFHSAKTFAAITIDDFSRVVTGDVTVQFLNTTTGTGPSVTIADGEEAPLHFDFSPSLSVLAGEEVVISCTGAGELRSVGISLQE